MRKWTLFLGIYFALCVLAACAAGGMPEPIDPQQLPEVPQETEQTAPETAELAVLYLRVLDDLWEKDRALNEGIDTVGVDLSATGLTAGQQAQVALLFGERHGVDVVQGTFERLQEQGYIVLEEGFPCWENGCMFTLAETERSEDTVSFTADKWRSALGAYGFADCTARKGPGGWTEYTVGAEFIS